jgi:hypothetical protein
MTKAELRRSLMSGSSLAEALPLSDGQDCIIFKADSFSPDESILYIPDIHLNQIPYDRTAAAQEIDKILGYCYTGEDFISICDGDVRMAKYLFCYCDWQHPSSAVDELLEPDGEPFWMEG